jgi:hydroxymethylglutaryl-CoA lyase
MFPKKVNINEVGARDGLQNERVNISLEAKVEFINLLSECNYKYIEVGSFVSPKWVPQMENSNLVYDKIKKNKKTIYPLLVPNIIGLHNALESNVQYICVFATASETFSQKNTNTSVEKTKKNIRKILKIALKNNLKTRAYLSCVLGCPYEGKISYKKTANLAKFLINEGCYEVSLGDTVGYGTPFETQKLIHEVSKNINYSKIAMHLHDTYGQALANIYASMQLGISSFDTSIGGLGGCPYAKGATGNVATEDVLYMLNGMGINNGINLKKVLAAGEFIYNFLGRDISSKAAKAMFAK